MRFNSRRNYLASTLPKTSLPAVFAACLFAAGHPLVAQAATTFNWTNGSNDNTMNNTSANWSTTGVNIAWGAKVDDIATFNATPTPTTVNVAAVFVIAGGLTFNASGWNLSAASLTGSGFASSGATTPFTVTLAAGVSASSDVAIASSAAHGLLVTGAGTFTTTNATTPYNGFTGGVTITNGATLSTGTATANAVLGPITNTVTLDNGTLAAGATIALSHTIFLGSGGGSVAETDAAETLTLANPIFDGNAADALTVSNANLGTVTLTSAANGYTGATNIMSGTLKLTGLGTTASSSQINVAAGAAFDVSAITGYTVAAQRLTGSGGTVIGDTALGVASIFLANLAATTPTLHFSRDLDLTALPALALSGTADGTDNYTLATFAGIESGTFSAASVAALPAGYTIDYGTLFPNAITLVAPDPPANPVPEPASLALLTLGAAALARRRHQPRRT